MYKLYVNDELFLVPLWHNESYFDGSGCEIIVICEPELPNGIKIDEDNNIHIEITKNFCELGEELMNNGNIDFNIGEKMFSIPLCNFFIKREQYYRLYNIGLSKVKKDIYDVSEKMDVIVKLTIVV
jgi:hypothetical protein